MPRKRKKGLTPGEMEVLELVVSGCKNKAIAHKLSISVGNVEYRVTWLMRKLHATGRVELAVLAVQSGLVAPPKTKGCP